jgi:glucokinase
MKAYNLNDQSELESFIKGNSTQVYIPETNIKVNYDSNKRIGVAISILGASKAIALGAYAIALNTLDSEQEI